MHPDFCIYGMLCRFWKLIYNGEFSLSSIFPFAVLGQTSCICLFVHKCYMIHVSYIRFSCIYCIVSYFLNVNHLMMVWEGFSSIWVRWNFKTVTLKKFKSNSWYFFLYEVIDIFKLLLFKSCASCSWLSVVSAISHGKMVVFSRYKSYQHLLLSMQIGKVSYSSMWKLPVCVYNRCMTSISLTYTKGTWRHRMSFWLFVLVEQSHKVGDFYFVGALIFNFGFLFLATISRWFFHRW
jgi:hypothetical protein